MTESKFEMVVRIINEIGYERTFAERIMDRYDENLAINEEGMRQGALKKLHKW